MQATASHEVLVHALWGELESADGVTGCCPQQDLIHMQDQ